MSSKDARLYGQPRHKKHLSGKDTSLSGSDLAFSSALTSLISNASNASSTSTTRRAKAATSKEDLFKSHNRNVKKRAASDMLAHDEEMAAARMDDTAWQRSKRRMEEKARLYAAMKRGDVEDENERHMVDFDRKWAEGVDAGAQVESEDDDNAEDDVVEYVDEFGRTRQGTRWEAAREERRKKHAEGKDDRFSAKPLQPDNIIYGNTVQTAAFNPDATVSEEMEQLAARRDKEPTPPEATHYDANNEVRSKGTGFFRFSADEETRQAQMQSLEEERKETERVRAEKDDSLDKRREEINQRRKMIQQKRGKMQANRFLEELELEMSKGQTP